MVFFFLNNSEWTQEGAEMLYEFSPEVREVPKLRAGTLTAGYVHAEELQQLYR